MEDISKILGQKVAPKQNKNIHSEVHYWTDIISSAFGERKKFAMYLGLINKIGITEARRIFAEIQDSHVTSPGRLFFWKAKQINQAKPKNNKI